VQRLVAELRALEGQGHPILSLQYEMLRVRRYDADFATTAIHAIDAVRHIVGAAYRTVKMDHQGVVGETARATASLLRCSFRDVPAIATINLQPVTGTQSERVTVTLRDHTFYLGALGNDVEPLYPDGPELMHISRGEVVLRLSGSDPAVKLGPPGTLDQGFYHENAAFLDTVRTGGRPAGDVASGLQAVEIADALRKRLPAYEAGSPAL
jgi:myo-inositol 2-dehydrogenase/D-chiro-inositol 1-dehydrogenase